MALLLSTAFITTTIPIWQILMLSTRLLQVCTRDIIGLIRSKSFTKSLSVLNAISIQKRKMQFSLLTALTGRNFIIFRSLSSHSFRGTLSRKRGSLNLRWNSFILCARQLQRSMRLACSGLQSSTISELPVSVSC